jgi:hypothetical protein
LKKIESGGKFKKGWKFLKYLLNFIFFNFHFKIKTFQPKFSSETKKVFRKIKKLINNFPLLEKTTTAILIFFHYFSLFPFSLSSIMMTQVKSSFMFEINTSFGQLSYATYPSHSSTFTSPINVGKQRHGISPQKNFFIFYMRENSLDSTELFSLRG